MNKNYIESNSKNISRAILNWGRKNFVTYTWRVTDTRWLALVAEIMLQRTRAINVIPVWEEFARQFPNPESVTRSTESHIKKLMQPLGLSWRAPLVFRLAEELSRMGTIPKDKETLETMPGLGDYSVSAFLSLHMNTRAVIIDANVVRWICRMTGEKYTGELRRQKWIRNIGEKLTPKRAFKDFNYAILDFTMNVCSRSPACSDCPIIRHCAYGSQAMAN